MSNTVIKVENLSKRYRIGAKEERHDTFVNAIISSLKQPFYNFKRLKRLTTFNADSNQSEDTIWALKDVSFKLKRGDVVGIIGRNGAGKSTLLKLLSRITYPTTGRIEMQGRVSSLLEVGTGFHPELTGRENIYLNGTILGMRKTEIDSKFDEILDFSGVGKFIDTPVKRFSSGMSVRLAFSVAAHLEPEILIIDEVLAVGDVEFQKKCIGKMGDVAGAGRTVLFVSHNMAAIQSLCPHSILLNNGSIMFKGPSTEAVGRYLENEESKVGPEPIELTPYRIKKRYPVFDLLTFKDASGKDCISFPIGSTIMFEFKLLSKPKIDSVHVSIAIDNLYGIRLFLVSTRFTGTPIANINDSGIIRAIFPDVHLLPGQYTIMATIGDAVTDYDIIDNVPGFKINPSDYWGTGKIPSPDQGVVIQNVTWGNHDTVVCENIKKD